MAEKKYIDPENLVLKLNKEVKNLDISKYEDFIMALCGDREYQMNAIRKSIKFYISDEYDNIQDLVSENYEENDEFNELFDSKDDVVNQLQLKNKLSCTIDFATGTGKTWVMYGVAQILLCEGLVDRVLILCPSKTIKKELLDKFEDFSTADHIKNSLPEDSEIKNPSIVDSSETITEGDICIDNVHKTYSHVSSSIEHSLEGRGEKILVINDEAHHMLNPKSHAGTNDKRSMLEWEKFLKDDKYNFKYILNSTGTPYKGDNYFKDVISRYSIKKAMEEDYIKEINYLDKDESKNWNEKFKAIHENHKEIKNEKYPEAEKHITIFVTDRINRTDEIADEIRDFLISQENISEEEAEEKVIPVTSSSQHEENVKKLETVDEPENPVEWIVSVSMLTEGWDVDNVFQIVPHEKRAFNSRLLISQVLGRGLRVPPEYRDADSPVPEVVIYNHDAWSEEIDDLVRHVAEISKTVTSRVMEDRDEYNFSLYQMNKKKEINKKEEKVAEGEVEIPESLGLKSESTLREQIYVSADSGEESVKKTDVKELIKTYTIDEAVNEIYNNIKLMDLNHDTEFTKEIGKDYIKELLKEELDKIGEDKVTEENLQRAKNAFNVIYRKVTGYRPVIELEYQEPEKISTAEMNNSNISLHELKRNCAIIYSEDSISNCSDEEKEIIQEAINEIKGKYNIKIEEEVNKTPVNLTILSFSNEMEFGKRLKREENAERIDAWVKSRDRGFYSIPYIYRPGTHSKQKHFNPDFIIKKGNDIIIVEIKSDEDTNLKNQAKLKGAEKYFEELNEKIDEHNYHFYFLSPTDYTGFFEDVIRNREYEKRYELHSDLLKKTKSEARSE
ncbi:hypothetical protein C9439_02150 [archaeon SCG-AAA382B04]|nr:hypothetical protein C9439_02150 [archaeon SCG-AAA382B04]